VLLGRPAKLPILCFCVRGHVQARAVHFRRYTGLLTRVYKATFFPFVKVGVFLVVSGSDWSFVYGNVITEAWPKAGRHSGFLLFGLGSGLVF
jgi:hypothetical protein